VSARDEKCPGCEETKRALEFASPYGHPVMMPHEWLPPHNADCPAAKPLKFLGMDVWTHAEEPKR
jgi:hypothetical protein